MSIQRPVQINEFIQTIALVSDEELEEMEAKIVQTIDKLNELVLYMVKEIHTITEKYEKTNSFYTSEDTDFDDDDVTKEFKNDKKLYTDSILENKIVLRNNHQRLELIVEELNKRGLKPKGWPKSLETIGQMCGVPKEAYSEYIDEE